MASATRTGIFSLTAGVLTALASGFTSAVEAAPTNGPSACTGTYSATAIFTTGFACKAGDKIYSNFFNTGAALPGNFSLSITDADPFHILSTNGTFSGGVSGTTYGFGYSMAVDTILSPDRYIANYETDFQLAGSPGSVLVATKTLQSVSPLAAVATAVRTNGIAPSPSVFLPVGTQTVDFLTSIQVSPNQIVTGFTDTVIQKDITVPGPLPILGAAAAFRASRRMRKRVKLGA